METTKNLFVRMLNFDTMITPTIIKLIYSVSTVLSALFGLILVITGIGARYGGGSKVFMGLVVIVVSPFITRIWCETMIIIFKINENLARVARQKQEY